MKWFLAFALLALAACAQESSQQARLQSGATEILGGEAVRDDQSWARAIVLIKASNDERCTGTLIEPDLVLTASHCVEILDETGESATLTVHVRKANGGFDEFKTGVLRSHEDYAVISGSVYNDIALIQLEKPVDPSIKPLKVAAAMNNLSPRTELVATGYGKTKDFFVAEEPEEILRTVDVKPSLKLNGQQISPRYTEKSEMIVVDQKSERGICSGDSGGPLLRKVGTTFEVVGVANLVTNPANQQAPCVGYGAYQNVVFHKAWLKSATQDVRAEVALRAQQAPGAPAPTAAK